MDGSLFPIPFLCRESGVGGISYAHENPTGGQSAFQQERETRNEMRARLSMVCIVLAGLVNTGFAEQL